MKISQILKQADKAVIDTFDATLSFVGDVETDKYGNLIQSIGLTEGEDKIFAKLQTRTGEEFIMADKDQSFTFTSGRHKKTGQLVGITVNRFIAQKGKNAGNEVVVLKITDKCVIVDHRKSGGVLKTITKAEYESGISSGSLTAEQLTVKWARLAALYAKQLQVEGFPQDIALKAAADKAPEFGALWWFGQPKDGKLRDIKFENDPLAQKSVVAKEDDDEIEF